jgi:hypothetical protein
MMTMEAASCPVKRAQRTRQVCDHCGGPFGMVTHRWWGSKFCKRGCKDAHRRETMLQHNLVHRCCELLAAIPRPRSELEAKESCIA